MMNRHTPFKEEYQVGDCVFAYFNSNRQTLQVYKAFPIAGPTFGLTQGFVKAIIVKVNKVEQGSLLSPIMWSMWVTSAMPTHT